MVTTVDFSSITLSMLISGGCTRSSRVRLSSSSCVACRAAPCHSRTQLRRAPGHPLPSRCPPGPTPRLQPPSASFPGRSRRWWPGVGQGCAVPQGWGGAGGGSGLAVRCDAEVPCVGPPGAGQTLRRSQAHGGGSRWAGRGRNARGRALKIPARPCSPPHLAPAPAARPPPLTPFWSTAQLRGLAFSSSCHLSSSSREPTRTGPAAL